MQPRSDERLAVLEEKLNIYEELSREMLYKLESAVSKISEANQNISMILTKHEARLDQTEKADEALLELIKNQRSDLVKIENRVNDLSRFRWIAVGVATAATVIITASNLFADLLTPDHKKNMMRGNGETQLACLLNHEHS
jgi:hypothetical protein